MRGEWNHHETRRSRDLDQLADSLAGVPTEPDERYFHDDIRDLSTGELQAELGRVRAAALWKTVPCAWALDRIERIEAERERRSPQ